MWCRDNLGYLVRMVPCSLQHNMSVCSIHGHSRLCHDMLPMFEGFQNQCTVHIWPRSDADSVNVRIGNKLLPVVVHVLYSKFIRYALARLPTSITNSKNRNCVYRGKAGDMSESSVATSANETNVDRLRCHFQLFSRVKLDVG